MAIARVVTYECRQCGSEIVVTETGETVLAPIYCCGVEVIEAKAVEGKRIKPGKKTAKKATKKIAKKKVIKKTKTAPKKK